VCVVVGVYLCVCGGRVFVSVWVCVCVWWACVCVSVCLCERECVCVCVCDRWAVERERLLLVVGPERARSPIVIGGIMIYIIIIIVTLGEALLKP